MSGLSKMNDGERVWRRGTAVSRAGSIRSIVNSLSSCKITGMGYLLASSYSGLSLTNVLRASPDRLLIVAPTRDFFDPSRKR